MELIDKAAIVAEIEKRMQELHPTNTHEMQTGEKVDRDVLMWLNALTWVKGILNSIKTKDVDLEKESINYLLNGHKSPLTKVMHGVDLGTEMQYHKDIQNAFKAGYNKAMEERV